MLGQRQTKPARVGAVLGVVGSEEDLADRGCRQKLGEFGCLPGADSLPGSHHKGWSGCLFSSGPGEPWGGCAKGVWLILSPNTRV